MAVTHGRSDLDRQSKAVFPGKFVLLGGIKLARSVVAEAALSYTCRT